MPTMKSYCRGRADPFGVLVLLLVLALSVTLILQAQASSSEGDMPTLSSVCESAQYTGCVRRD